MTCIRIEKVKKSHIDESQVAHKAGGQHQGLVVNRQASGNQRKISWDWVFEDRYSLILGIFFMHFYPFMTVGFIRECLTLENPIKYAYG